MDRPIMTDGLDGLTPWFCAAECPPVRPGWYQVRYWSDVLRRWSFEVFRYWDGGAWSDEDGAIQLCPLSRYQWRGRTAP